MFFALAPITTNSNIKTPLVRLFDLPEGLVKVRPHHMLIWCEGEGGMGRYHHLRHAVLVHDFHFPALCVPFALSGYVCAYTLEPVGH